MRCAKGRISLSRTLLSVKWENAMRVGGYEIDIVVQGYPGKAVCHGGLGWSTIVLNRHGERVALVDCGSFGMRKLLIERLAARGLKPADVTDLLLTHSHYDHSVNWTLFHRARIVAGRREMAWSIAEPWGETVVPELYVSALDAWPTLARADEGDEVFPGITAHLAPGHTPGHLVFRLHGAEHDVIFVGDAAKNRAELLCRRVDATFDEQDSAASIDMIWRFWRDRPGNVVAPGHDLPMRLENDEPVYLGERQASIQAWFGDDIETTTTIDLTRR